MWETLEHVLLQYFTQFRSDPTNIKRLKLCKFYMNISVLPYASIGLLVILLSLTKVCNHAGEILYETSLTLAKLSGSQMNLLSTIYNDTFLK